MIKLQTQAECCGCNACVEICPKKCIKMQSDKEGFYYPIVDEKECVDCGLCQKVCPMLGEKENSPQKIEAYAAMCRDEDVRMSSSSGGIFYYAAKQVLEQKGVVFGAAFDSDFLVEHVEISNSEELGKLQGSKYLQSRAFGTFQCVKERLNVNVPVLYSGTECQIEGLKNFLGKEYENLYTIDVLCHGVPSSKVWEKYLDEKTQKYHSKVKDICFRNKENGWSNYNVRIQFENGAEYKCRYNEDDYMKLFLADICLRPSCHNCRFKNIPRKSDLTLGDCWGVEKYFPQMYDNKGTSIVMANTEKGERLLRALSGEIELQTIELEKAIPHNGAFKQNVEQHRNRAKFFANLEKRELGKLVKLCEAPIYKRAFRKIKRIIKKCLHI